MVERSLSMREVPGSIPGASTTFEIFLFEQLAKKSLHRPGIEPGPPAWQASILPLNQRCYTWKLIETPNTSKFWKCQSLCLNKKLSQLVGFEPTLPEGNWFRVSRLNHSATTAVLLHGIKEDEHRWFSGRMLACHAGGPGSIPGRCKHFFCHVYAKTSKRTQRGFKKQKYS